MIEKEEVKEYYDDFINHQEKIGISTRQRIIAKNVKKVGVKNDANILEIGCGIGTVSKLLIKMIPNGQFVGCDISPKSIAYAKQFNPNNNAAFIVTDMSDFTHDLKFDLVVFPDVLEHIPVDQHFNLFENVAKVCSSNAKWYINIPEPHALNYSRENNPELLQIIDQSLSMQDLLNNVYPHGFVVESIIPYTIHMSSPNYLKIIFTNNPKVNKLTLRNKFVNIWQNFTSKI
ncbi:MAG: class I SAM-dependent methyltransferase [Fluviicola sp.]|nr:class I SAM-dependent methyltransferase [Fluviicola sp.]MBP6271064.1 class I SAM-dependent methyltransferase [Fluviicola sp.]